MNAGAGVTRARNFQGVEVSVREGVPTPRGEGVEITFPDGSVSLAAPSPDHRTLDSATAYAVNRWRVDQWRRGGTWGAI